MGGCIYPQSLLRVPSGATEGVEITGEHNLKTINRNTDTRNISIHISLEGNRIGLSDIKKEKIFRTDRTTENRKGK